MHGTSEHPASIFAKTFDCEVDGRDLVQKMQGLWNEIYAVQVVCDSIVGVFSVLLDRHGVQLFGHSNRGWLGSTRGSDSNDEESQSRVDSGPG